MQRHLQRNKRKYSQLQNYATTEDSSMTSLFTQAQEYPSFFEDNLVDPSRTIKVFVGQEYAHQTIFYFQLLRLIYETEDIDYEQYLSRVYDLIDNPQFQFLQPEQQSEYYLPLSGQKMKRMLAEFLSQMGEGGRQVTQMLAKYPIMDPILVIFMRTILVLGSKCQSFAETVEPIAIYQLLSQYFDIEVTYYSNCLRFNLTDLFVYLQGEDQIYLAYINPQSTKQELPSSEEYYQNQPEQAFNISTVHQMVSEINIGVEECFNLQQSQNRSLEHSHSIKSEAQYLQYDYSHTQQIRRPSRSVADRSDLKLSCLAEGDSYIQCQGRSNGQIDKDCSGDKKPGSKNILKKDKIYQIVEAPYELQNCSPVATPNNSKLIFPRKQQALSKNNIKFKEQIQFAETGQSQTGFRLNRTDPEDGNWDLLRKQTQMLLGNCQNQQKQTQQKNIKTIYQVRSIRTINSCTDGQSFILQTPGRSSFNPSFQPSFQSSFYHSLQPSRKVTNQNVYTQPIVNKPNKYVKQGYVNNNISTEFTNSILLKSLGEPFKKKIEDVKTRAREQRASISNMIKY